MDVQNMKQGGFTVFHLMLIVCVSCVIMTIGALQLFVGT